MLVPSCLVRRIPVAILAHHARAAFMPRDRINGTERGDTFRLADHEGCILLRDETKFSSSLVKKGGKGQGVSTDMKLFLIICVPVRLFSFATAERPRGELTVSSLRPTFDGTRILYLTILSLFKLFTSPSLYECNFYGAFHHPQKYHRSSMVFYLLTDKSYI